MNSSGGVEGNRALGPASYLPTPSPPSKLGGAEFQLCLEETGLHDD